MLLSKKLRAAGLNFQITNASAAGGTTQGGLERLPGHLKRQVDIFIVELGINDAFRGLPVDQIQTNLQQIIDKVKARNPNVRVVIAGMQLPNYAADDYVSAFGKMFADLAVKNDATLVPVPPPARSRESLNESVRWNSPKRGRPKDSCRNCVARARAGSARSGHPVLPSGARDLANEVWITLITKKVRHDL